VVFDCNVYFQALISPSGPAGECLDEARRGSLLLYVSEYVLRELTTVCQRPALATRFKITSERIDHYLADISATATIVEHVPHVFDYQRDPGDEHYVNLAVACNARLIVSRDKDLLALTDELTAEGLEFRKRFPDLQILKPDGLLQKLKGN